MTCPHCQTPIYHLDIIYEESITSEEWIDDNYKSLADRQFCPYCHGDITDMQDYDISKHDSCEVCGGEMIHGLCRFCDLGE